MQRRYFLTPLSVPRRGLCPNDVQLLPDPVLQIEGVHIVEVLAVPQVVVETTEDQHLLLNHHHAVTASRRGAPGGGHLDNFTFVQQILL